MPVTEPPRAREQQHPYRLDWPIRRRATPGSPFSTWTCRSNWPLVDRVALAREEPPEGDEAQSPDEEEEPVVERHVRGQIADVVQLEQVMVDQPLDDVEQDRKST